MFHEIACVVAVKDIIGHRTQFKEKQIGWFRDKRFLLPQVTKEILCLIFAKDNKINYTKLYFY